MATNSLLARIEERMTVRSADGYTIGQIRHIWYGTDPSDNTPQCDEEVCSRLEVHHGPSTTYIPVNAIADVARQGVTLTVDADTVNEKGWYRKPRWIEDTDLPTTPLGPPSR